MGVALLIIIMVIWLFFAAVGIAAYVLKSLGLYRLAKNRGADAAWLAWIPIGDAYIMGYLSEGSPYIKRKFPKMHVICPSIIGGYILLTLLYSLFTTLTMSFTVASIMNVQYSSTFLIISNIFFTILALFVLALYVFIYYHIFKAYEPRNAVLYTVLSAFGFSFVFFFVIRNKNLIFEENDLLADDTAES